MILPFTLGSSAPEPGAAASEAVAANPAGGYGRLFATVVVDPPWPISMAGRYSASRHSRPRRLPYRTMTLEEIKTLPIPNICAEGAHVYLWATNKTLRAAFDCFDAWGVRFHLTLVTVKKSGIAPAHGYVFGTEFCLLGFYGRPMLPFTSTGALNWWIDSPRHGFHSVKPQVFYERVERMSPGPYADVFARKAREGWSVSGDEVTPDFVLINRYYPEAISGVE